MATETDGSIKLKAAVVADDKSAEAAAKNIVTAIENVTKAASGSTKASTAAAKGFDTQRASVEELYQELTRLNEEYSKAEAAGSKAGMTKANVGMNAVASELMERGVSGTREISGQYEPAFLANDTESKIAAYTAALEQAQEALAFIKEDLATMPAGDSSFESTSQRAAELETIVERLSGTLAGLSTTTSNASAEAASGIDQITEAVTEAANETTNATSQTVEAAGQAAEQEAELSADSIRQIMQEFGIMDEYNAIVENYGRQAGRNFIDAFSDVLSEQGTAGIPDFLANYEVPMTPFDHMRDIFSQLKVQAQDFFSSLSGIQASDAEMIRYEQSLSRVGSALSTVIGWGGKAAGAFAKLEFSLAKLMAKGAVNGIKGIGNGIKAIGDRAAEAKGKLDKSVGSILRMALGVRGMFALIRKVRTIAISALNDIAKQVPEFNAQMSELSTAWSGLKGAVGTAIQPIVSALIGPLTTVINLLTQALTLVGQFFAALTGQKSVYKATAAQQDYAKSLKGTGGAAKDAQKSVLGFDELNKLQDNNGGGAGGGVTYEESPIDESMLEMIDALKKMWEAGDFTELGQKIAEELTKAFTFVDNWLLTTGNTFIQKLASSFGTLINGIVNTTELATIIGKTIADAIMIAINGIDKFLTTVNWKQVGTFIGQGITSFLNTLNGHDIGKAIADLLLAGINFMFSLVKNINWTRLGQIINDTLKAFFKTMNTPDEVGLTAWQKIGIVLSDTAIGLIKLLVTALTDLDWTAIYDAIVQVIESIDWLSLLGVIGLLVTELLRGIVELIIGSISAQNQLIADAFRAIGLDSIAGWFEGISTKLKNVITWLRTNVFEPVINGIKQLFGIHSPSTVMAEIGTNITQGLLDGISSLIDKVKNIWNNLKTSVLEIIDTMKTAIGDRLNAIKTTFSTIFTTIKTSVSNTVKSMVNAVIGTINSMISGVVSGINAIFAAASFNIDTPFGSIGLNLPQISAPQIPMLAQGAVIPPNAPFLAALGDQRHGNNIEAPEDLIRQIVRDESGAGNEAIVDLLEELINVVGNISVGDDVIGRAADRYTANRNRAIGVY